MITDSEIQWLKKHCPALQVSEDRTEVSGDISFTAAYDTETGLFTWLLPPKTEAPGLIFQETYKILIKKHKNEKRMPSLRISNGQTEWDVKRHYYEDGRACLNGPVEEHQFMKKEFSFLQYFEMRVIPFLYGQKFYDEYHKWPWAEYAHCAAGILESFFASDRSKEMAEICFDRLKNEKSWSRVKSTLLGGRLPESSKCLCGSSRQLRLCHGTSLFKIMNFRQILSEYSIPITD